MFDIMRKYSNRKEISNACWVVNIEIPDDSVIAEITDFIYDRVNKTLRKHDISEAHREFLLKRFHVATSEDSVREMIKKAKENSEYPCVIIAFNASLSQEEYNRLGVVGFKYISWTKNAWSKIKNKITIDNLKKLLMCFFRSLIGEGCQTLISLAINSISQ